MTSPRSEVLRIVQVVNTLSREDGGPARNSFELNRALNRGSGPIADLFWMKGDLTGSVLIENGVSVENLPTPGPRKLSITASPGQRKAGLLAFIATLARADVLIIHGYYLPWIPAVAILGWISRCRVYIMPHGSLTARQQKYSTRKKRVFDWTAGWVVRRVLESFVTGSEIERDELARKFQNANVRVAGVGVPLPPRVRVATPVHSPVRLLSMSRIASKKRIDISIDAVRALRDMGVEAKFVVAGSGSELLVKGLQQHAKELGVDQDVSFVGPLAGVEKIDAFCSSDVFLLPSEDENFGIGFAEAVSFGVPTVVSSHVAAAADLPPNAGFVIDNPDGQKIAGAILDLLHEDFYLGARLASLNYARTHFSWDGAAAKWLSVIDD